MGRCGTVNIDLQRRKNFCYFTTFIQNPGIGCTGYTHKTSGFKTSGFKTSGFKTSGFKTSGLQNVRFTKRQVSKRLVSKRPVFYFDILAKQKV